MTTPTPGSAPAGRAAVKLPPAYTVLPMTIVVQTTPFSVWAVGRTSEVTVCALRASTGAGVVSCAATATGGAHHVAGREADGDERCYTGATLRRFHVIPACHPALPTKRAVVCSVE